MNLRWLTLSLTVLLTVLLSHTYMVCGADKVADVNGYLVALGLLPVALGIALGAIGAGVAAKAEGIGIRSLLYIPVFAGVSALLPIGWTLLMMSQAQ